MTASAKVLEQIIKAHTRYNANVAEAARHLPVSHETVRKYWKKEGLI